MKFILFPLCFILYINLNAQKKQDVIYLDDGSIIRGKIADTLDKKIKIESYGGNVFVYPLADITKITREKASPDHPIKKTGYFNFTSIGTVFGSSLNDKPAPFSFLMEHNYRPSQYFALGIVAGIEMLNETVMPLGGNIKVLLPTAGGGTYFWGISTGYSFPLEKPKYIDNYYEVKDAWGGYMFNTEVGVMIPASNNASFFVAAGYRYNELSYVRDDWYLQRVDRKIFFNRISLRVGISFY